jgi:hypothetical protein
MVISLSSPSCAVLIDIYIALKTGREQRLGDFESLFWGQNSEYSERGGQNGFGQDLGGLA